MKIKKIIELISTRNIIVHNRGNIDDRYLAANPDSDFKLGKKRKLEIDDFTKSTSMMKLIIKSTDHDIAKKFKLETISVLENLQTLTDQRFETKEEKKEDQTT